MSELQAAVTRRHKSDIAALSEFISACELNDLLLPFVNKGLPSTVSSKVLKGSAKGLADFNVIASFLESMELTDGHPIFEVIAKVLLNKQSLGDFVRFLAERVVDDLGVKPSVLLGPIKIANREFGKIRLDDTPETLCDRLSRFALTKVECATSDAADRLFGRLIRPDNLSQSCFIALKVIANYFPFFITDYVTIFGTVRTTFGDVFEQYFADPGKSLPSLTRATAAFGFLYFVLQVSIIQICCAWLGISVSVCSCSNEN
jgi:hypothetical protein